MISIQEQRLLEKYKKKLPEKVDALKEAIANEDIQEVRGLLHKFTGSAGMYGFNHLSGTARSVYNLIMKEEAVLSSSVFLNAIDELFNQMLNKSSAIEE